MVKVLHICMGTMVRGGMESYVMNLYRAVDKNRCQFGFLVTGNKIQFEQKISSAFDKEIWSLGGEIFSIGVDIGKSHLMRNLEKSVELFKLLRELHTNKGYSAVHIHTDSASKIPELFISWLTGYKVRIVHSHSSTGHSNTDFPGWRFVYRLFSTHRLACSVNAGEWLFGKKYKSMQNTKINPNAIDMLQYSFNEEQRSEYRGMLSIKNKTALGHVGSFTEVKNHRFLLQIFKVFLSYVPNSVLLLAGDGELFADIKKLADKMNILDSIIFLGTRDDIAPIMMAMDCFVMPSLYEGLPVTLIEAQAVGLPIVAADTITSESRLTDTFKFISLDAPPDKWAKAIKNMIEQGALVGRTSGSGAVREAGYEINDSLEYFYTAYKC